MKHYCNFKEAAAILL